MKIVFITGSHPRHKFLARKIEESGHLSLIISQKREPFVPAAPRGIDKNISDIYYSF